MRWAQTVGMIAGLLGTIACGSDSGMRPSGSGASAGRSVLVPAAGSPAGRSGSTPPMSTPSTGASGTGSTAPMNPPMAMNVPQPNPTAGMMAPPAGTGGGGMAGMPPTAPRAGAAAAPMTPTMPSPADPNAKKPPADKLPQVAGTCPTLATGSVTVAGATARLWVGSSPGPAYFYFHGTGTTPGEVDQGLPGATLGVVSKGGLVASWETSNGKGTNTGTIWYTGDLEGMDQIVACGVQKGIIDTSRIHVAGYSAGGLETGAAVFGRSSYVASAIVYSGGKPFGVGLLQDPNHVPAVLGAHGAKGSDSLGLDFHDGTIALGSEIVRLGGFAVDCDDGGDHVGAWFTARAGVGGKAMQFLADHPYNTKPSPYAGGLPAGFPSYCKIVK